MNEGSEQRPLPRELPCANCGEMMSVPLGSSIAAEMEARMRFPGVPKQEMAVVCGKCYIVLHGRLQKMSPKDARRRHWWSRRN